MREVGVKPDKAVGIVMDKGWEQVVAVYGTLKSGAAYLPIDPTFPKERILHLLKHGEVTQVLTQSWIDKKLEWPDSVQRICVDTINLTAMDQGDLPAVQKSDNLAYVLYTSGSTGFPKGVMIEHRSVVNRVLDVNQRFNITKDDRVIAITGLQHDLSVYDLFGTLLAGATLVIPNSEERLNPAYLTELMVQEQVTIWNSVPAFMEMLVDYLENNIDGECPLPTSLRQVMMSGDWIPVTLPNRIRKSIQNTRVCSLGGPTETTVWDICYPIEKVDPEWKSIPYGRPMVNAKYYVFSESLKECPDWVVGELYMTGVGLARGYWRDDVRTAERFINNPKTGKRMYRSGDLGRYLPDGNIEIVGRADFQVKIRGYRIELGEIESAINKHADVREAVVTVSGDSQLDRRLIAYVVPSQKPDKETITQGEVAEYGSENVAEGSGGFLKINHSNKKMSLKRVFGYARTNLNRLLNAARHFRNSMPGFTQPRYYFDPAGGLEFKLKRLGIRQNDEDKSYVQLIKPEDNESLRNIYLERQSYRNYLDRPLAFEELSAFLTCLLQLSVDELPFPKNRYPSAGSLYPVQAYLYIKPNRVEGLSEGCYYYHSSEHRLVMLTPGEHFDRTNLTPNNYPVFDQSAFLLFLIGQMKAIEPMYGKLAESFCMLEAGYMSQLMMQDAAKNNIGLCPVGSVVSDKVKKVFLLDDGHLFLHALLGGPIDFNQRKSFALYVETGGDAPRTPSFEEASNPSLDRVLIKFLTEKLPDYMVPAQFVFLDELPLTPNGKIDRKSLPAPENGNSQGIHDISVGELSPSAEQIAGLVAGVLKHNSIDPFANLLDLGATSIHFVMISNQMERKLGYRPKIDELYRFPTVAALAASYDRKMKHTGGSDEGKKGNGKSDSERIAEALGKVKQLSKDEIQSQLKKDG